MTANPNRAMLFSLGIFLGLVFFGVSVSLTHFNRLVEPERPLNLLEWRWQEEQAVIRLLGENIYINIDRDLPGKLGQQAFRTAAPALDKVAGWPSAVRQEIQANGWDEKMQSLVERAKYYASDTMGQD